ncbi:MAG: single-stranded-DNA-specific exonuclease RecJ [Deltaproteobacteria bacterium]|nr:single-stranded-DNA-specific exonuclease RecJ [Deltaproteobacteria bacterium]
MKARWILQKPDRRVVDALSRGLSCHRAVAAALANRGLADPDAARRFLFPSIADLSLPSSMADIDKAAERLARAVVNGEGILVFGDYDADGVCATALLTEFLEQVGGRAVYRIPCRETEGYGIKPGHVRDAAERRAKVIATVDCGISGHEAAAAAARCGVDLLVTDHHEPGETLPPALAVVDPKRRDCPSGLCHLSGTGVAFFLCAHIRAALREAGWFGSRPEPNLLEKCDLVALGTVADLVPLTGENRILVRAGLEAMRTRPRPGIAALMDAAGVPKDAVNERDVAFSLAPRINAAGRLDHAGVCVELLRTTSQKAAASRARKLEALNGRRKLAEGEVFAQALEAAQSEEYAEFARTLVLAGDWHQGVVGISAARLMRRLNRPVALLCTNGKGPARGSARSIPGLDLMAILSRCSDLLHAYGGHAMAAGLEVLPADIPAFAQRFEAEAQKAARGLSLAPEILLDWPLSLTEVGPALADELEALRPFGEGNPEPLFLGEDVAVASQRVVGRGARRLSLSQNGVRRPVLSAIWFSPDTEDDLPPLLPRVCFKINWNHFRGQTTLQLEVEGVDLG